MNRNERSTYSLLRSTYSLLLARFLFKIRPALLADALKRLLRVRRQTIDTNAGKFWIDPVSILGMTLMREGTYEPASVSMRTGCFGTGYLVARCSPLLPGLVLGAR